MKRGRTDIINYSNKLSDWYWINGLHDACITGVETFELPFDYNKFTGEKNKCNHNLLSLAINSKAAIYDNTVEEIRFFNYKLLTDGISLNDRKEIWWIADRLTDCGDYYILEIDLQDFNSEPENFTVKIKFERAEVVR